MTDRISAGGEIDSYCTKCRLILDHIIVAMDGGAIVKVKCKTCGSSHKFRGIPAAGPNSPRKAGAGPKVLITAQAQWETALVAAKGPELPYDMSGSYRAGDLIVHSVFGKGVVQKALFRKCSVLFKDKERVLATSNT